MATREEFLRELWSDVINKPLSNDWIDFAMRTAKARADAPFADVGMAVDRLLKLGASREDLSAIARWAGYEAAFSTLFALEDPGVEGPLEGLYSQLIDADPTGRAGRPDVAAG
ncbi:MAG TPA: hypothetical protein VHQ47_06610 [Phycisphaerae bacterium]|nr:hypothetical protein [Phycisphaerae bacterium]